MKLLEKIGQAGLATISLAGAVAIGYLTYRGVMDVMSTPNAVLELDDVYHDGLKDGRRDGFDDGYDAGFADGIEGCEYHGPSDVLALKYNQRDLSLEADIMDLFRDGEESSEEDAEGFTLKNAFRDEAEGAARQDMRHDDAEE